MNLLFAAWILFAVGSNFPDQPAYPITESEPVASVFERNGVTGTFVAVDPVRHTIWVHNRERAQEEFVPASTFKIVNALIGVHLHTVSDVDEILPYGGGKHAIAAWERDMSIRNGFPISNVPIYQELARRTGLDAMREWVERLNYGNGLVGDHVDRFWLDGPLKISALKQTDFLWNLATRRLPISRQAQDAVAEIALVSDHDDIRLYGKTGWASGVSPQVAWFVGWVERDGEVFPFASNIEVNSPEDGEKRKSVALESLKALGILPEDFQ